jgi:hypothetical protein
MPIDRNLVFRDLVFRDLVFHDLVFMAVLVAGVACSPVVNNVVENESDSAGEGGGSGGGESGGVVELEPPEGSPEAGPPVFEITVDAEIVPLYESSPGVELVGPTLRLWHCGAKIAALDGMLVVADDTVEIADIGAVVHVDYHTFDDFRISFSGGGTNTLSLVYDDDGTPFYSESPEWNGGNEPMGTFVRALDIETPLFRFDTVPVPTITVLDPSAAYDPDTGALAVAYAFATTDRQTYTITETYTFASQHAPPMSVPAPGCD